MIFDRRTTNPEAWRLRSLLGEKLTRLGGGIKELFWPDIEFFWRPATANGAPGISQMSSQGEALGSARGDALRETLKGVIGYRLIRLIDFEGVGSRSSERAGSFFRLSARNLWGGTACRTHRRAMGYRNFGGNDRRGV